jgi:hypothetical protein
MKILTRHPVVVGTALLTIATAGLYGCKDFLSNAAAPQGTLDEGTLANRLGVEGTLIAAYRTLDCTSATSGNWGCAASNWVWGSVASDDAYAGSAPNDQPGVNDTEAYSWGTPNAETYLNVKWQNVYEGVVRSNSTLRLLKRVIQENPGELSAADASGIEGEALFLRAHYHFEAWRMWGNIPYYREDDADFRKANIPSAQVVTELLADLDAAIAKLPTTPRNGQKGRATQWTAKAYKGRVQVYAGQHAAALTTLREIRTSGPYALEASYDRVWTGFQAFANGPETIFAFQASAKDGEPDGNNANWGERLNFPHSGSPLGCCGFHQPSQNLVNFFKVDAAGLPLALSSPSNWNASDANLNSSTLTPIDPRLDWTAGRDGVPFKDWGLHSSSGGWVRSIENGGPYSPKKNVHENASGAQSTTGWVNTQLNSVNIHLFRYADLLLLLAEAEVEAGSFTNALPIVNQIRARAGVTAQGCGGGHDAASRAALVQMYPACAADSRLAVPINDASIGWAVYRVGQYPAFPSQAYAREAVRAERRVELAMEGQRFFDLRRSGIAEQTINAYLKSVGGAGEENRRLYLRFAGPYAARHQLYPIPNIQIEFSKVGEESRLTQNTGW